MRASIADFLPDEELAFRSIGSGPVTETTATPPKALEKLEAYWTTDEWGIADKLAVVLNVKDIFFGDPEEYSEAEPDPLEMETYTFSLEVDTTPSFSSPITVASIDVDETFLNQYVLLTIDPEDMVEFDKTAKYVRLVATLDGEAPSLTFYAYVKG